MIMTFLLSTTLQKSTLIEVAEVGHLPRIDLLLSADQPERAESSITERFSCVGSHCSYSHFGITQPLGPGAVCFPFSSKRVSQPVVSLPSFQIPLLLTLPSG